jgi:type VI protein secretion system component Hcp
MNTAERIQRNAPGHRPVSVRRVALSLAVTLAAMLSSAALGQYEVVAVVTGDTQGAIQGSYQITPAPNSILVTEYHHLMLRSEVVPPEHKEVIFTKPVDEATVNLWEAYDTGELLTVAFEHWYQCPGGSWGWIHKVELTGATIRAIEPFYDDGDDLVSERIRLRYLQLTRSNQKLSGPDCSGVETEGVTVDGNFPP